MVCKPVNTLFLLLLGFSSLPGCGTGGGGGEARPAPQEGSKKAAGFGNHHAFLTAEFSKEGNKLHIYFERSEPKPEPLALPILNFSFKVRREGTDDAQEVVFLPAPASQRPRNEQLGTCSHFIGNAPWMKPDDKLSINTQIPQYGKNLPVRWDNFVPGDFPNPARYDPDQ